MSFLLLGAAGYCFWRGLNGDETREKYVARKLKELGPYDDDDEKDRDMAWVHKLNQRGSRVKPTEDEYKRFMVIEARLAL